MRRSATSVWKATIANIDGLPICPPDLNEPQYVSLAFSDHCHVSLYIENLSLISNWLAYYTLVLPCSQYSGHFLELSCTLLQRLYWKEVRSAWKKNIVLPWPTVPRSFVSDFDLRKRLPLHPTDNSYKTIFPYIVYPSEFTYYMHKHSNPDFLNVQNLAHTSLAEFYSIVQWPKNTSVNLDRLRRTRSQSSNGAKSVKKSRSVGWRCVPSAWNIW